MQNLNNAIEWLKASYDDLRAIEKMIDDEFLTNVVAFHSQQSIEKSFKSLIEFKQQPLQRTHNLEKLYEKIKSFITIKDLKMLEVINEVYIDSRYPGDFGLMPYGKPTLEEAKEFYEFAKDIFEKVCKILNISKEEIQNSKPIR